MSTTHKQLPLINEGFAFKKAGERITHSEWNAVIELLAKCYNALVLDTDTTANAILTALASKSEQGHTHDTNEVLGLSTLINTTVIKELEDAKVSGTFNGADGVSVTKVEINNNEELVITLSNGTVYNLGAIIGPKGEKGDKGDKGDDGKDGKDGADYILTDDDKSEIAAQVSGDCVSYSEAQALTKEQKETARNNIDAVDANLVVSSILDSSAHPRALKIPNVTALQEFIDEYTMQQCVRNDIQQHLSESSQEIVRSNIGAVSQTELEDGLDKKVDASRVVSNIISDGTLLSDNIPDGSALTAFVREHGVAASQAQSLSEPKKARARSNINAAEDAGTWELLYTIEGDGATYIWEFTKFADGSDLKLRAAAVKTINTVAAGANTYGFIYAYDSSFNTIGTAVITKFLSTEVGAVALGIIEQDKGYYRAYAADGASKNPGNVRYSAFQQYNKIGNIETTPYIPRIKVINQTTAYLPVGSTIEVWGVKA